MCHNGKKIAIGAIIAVILAAGLAVGAMYLAPSGSNPTTQGVNYSSSSLLSTSSGNSQATSSSQSSSGSAILGASGAMNIYLTDAPPSNPQFKYLLVNISSLVLKYQGNVSTSAPSNQWVFDVSSSTGMNVNLTNLVNNKVLLGATKAPTGNVTGIIFDISSARAFFTDGSSAQLKVVANGKLMVPINFTIGAGSTADLTVDITPNSIHISPGNTPVLTPVVHITDVETDKSSTSTAHGLAVLTNDTSTESTTSSVATTTSTGSTSTTGSSSTTTTSSTSTTSTTTTSSS